MRLAKRTQRPGAHQPYKVEIEPHFYYRYDAYGRGRLGYNGGVGPGVRATIILMKNGPIPSLNNNLGITFGLDIPFYWYRYANFPFGDEKGTAVGIDIPVGAQWNFFFTDIFSAFGELGLTTSIVVGDDRRSAFQMRPLTYLGARAQFGLVGVAVRLGYPSLSVGATFQF